VSLAIVVISALIPHHAFAQALPLTVRVNQPIFVPKDALLVYGEAGANDGLFITLSDPVGRVLKIETVKADGNGRYTVQLYTWPNPSANVPYGLYIIEVTSSIFGAKRTIEVKFTDVESAGGIQEPHVLAVKLDSPTEVSVNKTFRIFVQVTFDGALVDVADPSELLELLGSTHIHSGEVTINLGDKFNELHEGIYFADVRLDTEGTYIIHAVGFHRGFLAHDSKVIAAGIAIGDIQQSLNRLRGEIEQTSDDVKAAREGIKEDIEAAAGAVEDLKQASGQINSIILPILALISVIIALQVSLFARIRASFR
jgi:hypothetical protein